MEENLKLLLQEVEKHYVNDVVNESGQSLSDYDYSFELSRIEFESRDQMSPLIMTGHIINVKNIPISFESPETGKEIDAHFDFKYGLFHGLHYNQYDVNEYELTDVEGPQLINSVEKIKIEDDGGMTTSDIISDLGTSVSLDEYVQIMTDDIRAEIKDELIKITFTHLKQVSVR